MHIWLVCRLSGKRGLNGVGDADVDLTVFYGHLAIWEGWVIISGLGIQVDNGVSTNTSGFVR